MNEIQFKNIFECGEIDEKVVISVLENTIKHGAMDVVPITPLKKRQ